MCSVLLTPEWFGAYRGLLKERSIEQGIFIANKAVLEKIVGYGLHQGIMAIGRVPENIDLKSAIMEIPRPALVVALDGIANSENMGVIVRNSAAFGAHILISGETSCDPYLRRSVRNSMGTVFKLPMLKVASLRDELVWLRDEASYNIIAAHPRSDSIDLEKVDFTHDSCVVFGGEGGGISTAVLDICDVRATVRMSNSIDSINVASSVAVVLHEVDRQRCNVQR